MEPLSAMPRDTLARLRGVIFDVDDTLTTHGSLTAEAYAALWSLKEAGRALVAVTGRPLGWADAMAATWPVDLAIGENGAGWVHRREGALAHGYFHGTAEREAQRRRLEALREAVARDLPEVRPASDQSARRCDLAWDVGEGAPLPRATIDALVARIEGAGAQALVSSVHAHAVVGDWDKAAGTRRAVRDVLGIAIEDEPERWLFVGDSGNDAAAFAFFPVTVGVANVREQLHRLPTPPRWITERPRGAGFAELAAAIVRAPEEVERDG